MSVVNTNTNALGIQNAMSANHRLLSNTMAQLSTGQRINWASDDAAGLAIGNKLASQARSLDVAVRNANDGISMLQTADGATSQITSMLIRMRELAIQSGNDTYSESDRAALQVEFKGLQEQAGQIAGATSWNGMKLLAGEAGSGTEVKFHVGASSTDSISLPLAKLNNNDDLSSALAGTVDIQSQTNSSTSIGLIDKAISQINDERSKWGAVMNRLTHAADHSANISMNTKASQSRLMDADYAQATAELARAMILDQAGAAMLTQANQQPMYVLALLR